MVRGHSHPRYWKDVNVNNGLSVLALLGMTVMIAAAGCEQVTDLGHDAAGSGGLGGDSGTGGASSGGAPSGNPNTGVGDPCTPEDEYNPSFSGFSVVEVTIENRSRDCETNVCLVNHFQGRVSCPYGNSQSNVNIGKGQTPSGCYIPGTTQPITAPVDPQILQRQALDSVYCSCRCAGPDKNARYCDCPSGFACVELADQVLLGEGTELSGAYCIRQGTTYARNEVVVSDTCLATELNCG